MASKRALPSKPRKSVLLLNASKKSKLSKKPEPDSDIELVKDDPEAPTQHYLITEFKSDEDRSSDESDQPAECVEEIHFNELHSDEGGDNSDSENNINTREINEHVCGKCFKSFRLIKAFKRHLAYCIFNSEMVLRRAEMQKNIEKIEKEAISMENKDICFCCGDNYDTCHLGHINCTECPKTFKTQISLERHMFLIHSEKNDFPCDTCNGSIRTKALLKLHMEQHKNRGKPFACKNCGKDFTRLFQLNRHHKHSACGEGLPETMGCKVCGKKFFLKDNLRVHLRSHLSQGTPRKAEYTCPCCKKCFSSLSNLNIHIRTHTGERPFDCDICEKNFPSLVSLKKHRRSHTGEKPYTCDVCGQNFAVKEVLNRHMKRHTGEKPHVCLHCNKRFIQATQLKNHLRTHERPFECTECPEKFTTEKQFEKHFETHKSKKARKASCTCVDCELQFHCRAALTRHEKTARHIENVKKLRPECGIKCDDLKSLETTEYKCDKCDLTFRQLHLLQHHKKTVHNTDPAKPSFEIPVDAVKNEMKDCIKLEEFLVDSFATEVSENDQKQFTVIAQENDVSPDFKQSKQEIKKLSPTVRAELKESLVNCLREDPTKKAVENVMSADDVEISENVDKLLDMLVDVETLGKFGWPQDSVENVLCKVIENCGYNLYKTKFTEEYGTRMKEYVKLIHSEKNDFPYDTCNGSIPTKALLKLHMEQPKNRGKRFACKNCGKNYTRPYRLKHHHKHSACGEGLPGTMGCKVCGKKFVRRDNLRVHLKSHLSQGTPQKAEHTCPCCKKCFFSLSYLNIHIRTHTGERPFDCDICEKKFPSQDSLKKHRRSHTGEKPYTCDVCAQKFAAKEVLNRHMKRHTGEKPHVCLHCNKRFIQATQLKNHLRTHERPFECIECSEKFKTEKQFEKHYKTHKSKPSCTCVDCELQFPCRAALTRHEKTARHIENVKKFHPECGIECDDLKSLETTEYKCDKCDLTFRQLHLLQHHKKTVHNTDPAKPSFEIPVDAVKNEMKDCIKVEEFLVDSFATEVSENDQKQFIVIAQENDVSPDFKQSKQEIKKLSPTVRAELKESLVNCLREDPTKKVVENVMSAGDVEISENVGKLLDMLVDVETLGKFGWPQDSVENVLCKVIENCGYNLYGTKFTEEYGTRMREYVKLMFTVVIQNDSFKELLNNYPIDEVIAIVLSNEDDELKL